MPSSGIIARAATRYVSLSGRRPWLLLCGIGAVVVAASAVGAGLQVRSKLEDLFPEHTPAVAAAQQARAILPSINEMLIVFGSPSQQANRQLATDFCARVQKLPQIAAVDCHRDMDFFRKNGALWLPEAELLRIEKRVKKAITRATRKQLLGDEFGDDGGGTGPAEPDEFAEPSEFADPDEFAEPPQKIEVAAKVRAEAIDDDEPADPPDGATATLRMPTDEELQKRIGANADLREWAENKDGTVLGVKLFPRVDASDVNASKALVAQIRGILHDLHPTSRHPDMMYAIRGDYAQMSRQVESIRHGLAVTTGIALCAIVLLQLLAFRRVRALLLLFTPLVCGTALTVGFAAAAVGYLNIITAFIFAILFGLGIDFAVYTLSHYLEVRAEGLAPEPALQRSMPHLWGALTTAAATTAGGFLALTLFEFRGFSQFGLIAGVGVLLTLLATLLLFPPMIVVCHRIWPEKDVPVGRANGLSWLALLARRDVARVVTATVVLLALGGAWFAQDLDFNTDFRRLRTISKPPASGTKAAPTAATRAEAERKLGNRYGSEAVSKNVSPILVVADSMQDAKLIHEDIAARRDKLTRLHHFVSIHTFVPPDQAAKVAIATRIRERIEAKRAALTGEDGVEADKALQRLNPKPFTAAQLPDFVRKRFLDVDDKLGRYLLLYPNGNLADARSVQQVIDQVGVFSVGDKTVRATASYFMLAEADGVVRKEGPLAVLAAAIAVLLITFMHFRSVTPVLLSFVPLALGFCAFLGTARLLELELNLFSITVLPSVFGIGIDGTVHLVHRGWQARTRAELGRGIAQISGAAWLAALTTIIGFGALLFQDNRGVQTLGAMAVAGIAVVCLLANAMAASSIALVRRFEDPPDGPDL